MASTRAMVAVEIIQLTVDSWQERGRDAFSVISVSSVVNGLLRFWHDKETVHHREHRDHGEFVVNGSSHQLRELLKMTKIEIGELQRAAGVS